jgi:serralysin
MATITNNDPVYGLNFSAPFLLEDIGGATVTSNSPTQVILHNSSTGDDLALSGSFTSFNAQGQPVAGTLTGITSGLLSMTGISVPVTEAFAAPTAQNMATFVSDAASGNDLINLDGAPASNYILGYAGDDTINGARAPDANTLFGGAGNDSIIGGTAFDQVNGNQGDDTIVGRSTVGDWLLGGQGNDSIDASASTGANILNGNLGNDIIFGGSGADSLRGGQGDDVMHAGSGNDWISGDLGNNTIYGGQGADTFHASVGHDIVNGWHAGDHVQVDSGVTYTSAQVNSDVHVLFSNGGEMDLLGVQLSSLQSGWIG